MSVYFVIGCDVQLGWGFVGYTVVPGFRLGRVHNTLLMNKMQLILFTSPHQAALGSVVALVRFLLFVRLSLIPLSPTLPHLRATSPTQTDLLAIASLVSHEHAHRPSARRIETGCLGRGSASWRYRAKLVKSHGPRWGARGCGGGGGGGEADWFVARFGLGAGLDLLKALEPGS